MCVESYMYNGVNPKSQDELHVGKSLLIDRRSIYRPRNRSFRSRVNSLSRIPSTFMALAPKYAQ